MPDIAMCLNSYCPSRETCYRHQAIPNPGWQPYARFKFICGVGKCDSFIECKSKSQMARLNAQTKEAA